MDSAPSAIEIVEHSLESNLTDHRFDYDALPIYVCQSTTQFSCRKHAC